MAVHTGANTSSAHSAKEGSRHSLRQTALLLLSTLLVACSVPSTPALPSPTPEPTPAATPTVTASPAQIPLKPYLSPVDGECKEYFDEANEHTNVWYDVGPGREIRAIEDGQVVSLSSLVEPPEAPQLTGLALELDDGATSPESGEVVTIFMIVADDGGKFNPLEVGQSVKRGDVVGLTGNGINYLGVTGPLVVTRPGTDLHCSEFSAN